MNEIIQMMEERVARIEVLIERNPNSRTFEPRLKEARHLLDMAKQTRCEVIRLMAKDAGVDRV